MSQLPGVYREMAGVHAVEYAPIGWEHIPVLFDDDTELQAKQWCDILEADTAQVLARYNGDYFCGAPAITRNAFGSGCVYYIGAVGTQPLYDRIARQAAEEAHLPVIPGLPPWVELVTRTGRGVTAQFFFNNDDQPKAFTLDGQEIALAPFEMKVITR